MLWPAVESSLTVEDALASDFLHMFEPCSMLSALAYVAAAGYKQTEACVKTAMQCAEYQMELVQVQDRRLSVISVT